MRLIDTFLTRWLDPTTDPAERWRTVCDLTELVQRHGDFGNHPPYSFHDPALGKAPVRLGSDLLARVAAAATRVLLDPTEAEPMRVAAAFLLGKTHQKAGLTTLATLLRDQPDLPPALVRQCAFTFDTLGAAGQVAALRIDLDQVGDAFKRHGIPWDRATQRVDVNLL